ncbi:MAG TPA: UDP-N-acetylmuramoyl-tripeptide--D-alanyl-D-alanine ligase, partial [Anaerovoracaceae bacterium]|nr:UDP-N-acetylmuramoyl-tripeptide--D-alanyl-D-alanine ligase [Anaerovoracaceae bacterium]
IGISHLSRLGSRENILKAKMEICSFLGKDGVLVLNCDDNMLSPYENKDHKVIKIKSDNGGDFNISNVKDMGEKGVSFRLQHMVEHCDFKIAVPGVHNIMNGSLAVGTAYCFGVDMKKAAAGLEKFTSTDKRLHIISGRGIKIIDDTYNASPDSMVAALNVLSAVKSNRKIAILGDMFELGEDEAKHHRLIGEYASQKGINVVISVGKNAELISLAAKERGMDAFHFDSKDMLIGVISQWVRRGDAILIKGSRGMAMDEIANHLKSLRIE